MGVSNNRHRPVHDWVEVENVPFEGGMELPATRADGRSWPERSKAKWETWRRMPHAKLWQPAEWSFALDTLEIAAHFHKTGEPGSGRATEPGESPWDYAGLPACSADLLRRTAGG